MLTNDEAVKILELYGDALENVVAAEADDDKKFDSFTAQNNLVSYVLSLVSEEAQPEPEDDEPLKVGDRVKIKRSTTEWAGYHGEIESALLGGTWDWTVRIKALGKLHLVPFSSSELEKIR